MTGICVRETSVHSGSVRAVEALTFDVPAARSPVSSVGCVSPLASRSDSSPRPASCSHGGLRGVMPIAYTTLCVLVAVPSAVRHECRPIAMLAIIALILILIAIVALAILGFAAHILFSPWLLLVVAGILPECAGLRRVP
jgi:hypothetical protein